MAVWSVRVLLFSLSFVFFFFGVAHAESEKKQNAACQNFDKAIESGWSDKGVFHRKQTTINGEDPNVELQENRKFYEDDEGLYATFRLTIDRKKYEGLVSYYPEVKLIHFAEGLLPPDLTKNLNEIKPLKKIKDSDVVMGAPYKCAPLSKTVKGYTFDDGKDRKVIAHYVYGKRFFKGKSEWLGCGEWNYNEAQILFYVSTGGMWFQKNGEEIYVAGLGATKINYDPESRYTDIPQICNMDDYVQYRVVKADSEESDRYTKTYLENAGLAEGAGYGVYGEQQWELQVVRNILEGGKLFYHSP